MKTKIIHTPQSAQVIFVNHSGGKDSQAMLAHLVKLGFKDKIVIVHADLGEMEWEPMHDWIVENSFGCPVHVVKSKKDFFELSRYHKRLPGGKARFCTSELKTRPCEEFMREYCEKHGFTRAISALGMRAQESKPRRVQAESHNGWVHKTQLLTAWWPIAWFTIEDVREEIAQAGQKLHWVYKTHSRLSCVICVYGRVGEHKLAAKMRPEVFGKVAALEHELGKTIRTKQRNKVTYRKYLSEYLEA